MFEWLYKPGKGNPADPLSRMKVAERVLLLLNIPATHQKLHHLCALSAPRTTRCVARAQRAVPITPEKGIVLPSETLLPEVSETEANVPITDSVSPTPIVPIKQLSLDNIQERCRKGYVKDAYFLEKANTDVFKSTADGLLISVDGKLTVPNVETLRTDILKEIHDLPFGGHP